MSLTSINPNSQPSSLDLLATDNTNLTGFINTSDKPLTVSITAEGKWSLLKPDFATSDPGIIKYKTPVDGDGCVRDKNDEKFKFKYPTLNTAALVAEVKDAKGNLKSSVAGKKQTIELLPGESVSFTINDDPAYFKDNAGQLKIAYSIVPKSEPSSEPATTTRQNKWIGKRLDNQKTDVFTWVAPFWHQIIDGQTIKNNFKEVSNNYSTVVIDQGVGPLFLTADGAYWKGKRFAVGAFEFSKHETWSDQFSEFSKHETWSGQRPDNGGTVAYQFNKATGFWEEANNGVVTKNNFKEVENNKATVTIDQGAGAIYLTLDGAYYGGTKFASGNFRGK